MLATFKGKLYLEPINTSTIMLIILVYIINSVYTIERKNTYAIRYKSYATIISILNYARTHTHTHTDFSFRAQI